MNIVQGELFTNTDEYLFDLVYRFNSDKNFCRTYEGKNLLHLNLRELIKINFNSRNYLIPKKIISDESSYEALGIPRECYLEVKKRLHIGPLRAYLFQNGFYIHVETFNKEVDSYKVYNCVNPDKNIFATFITDCFDYLLDFPSIDRVWFYYARKKDNQVVVTKDLFRQFDIEKIVKQAWPPLSSLSDDFANSMQKAITSFPFITLLFENEVRETDELIKLERVRDEDKKIDYIST